MLEEKTCSSWIAAYRFCIKTCEDLLSLSKKNCFRGLQKVLTTAY